MYAHYFESRVHKEVIFTETPDMSTRLRVIYVDGKRTARRIAKEHNAQCWNF